MASQAIEIQAAPAPAKPMVLLTNSVAVELLTSGISVGCANTATNPLDVVKVRLQLQRNQLLGSSVKTGMVTTGVNVVRNEGVLALWSGLGPSLARGFFFGGARLGMYTPLKHAIVAATSPPQAAGAPPLACTLEQKIAAGSLSGGLAAAVTSPIELIKTRLQAAGRDPAAPRTSMGVIQKVVSTDGVVGLWKGAMPGLVRAAILTAAQCATYDEVKRTVISTTGWGQKEIKTHLTSSMIAGLVTTTVTNPLDVIKTRMYVGGKSYSGVLQCAADVMKREGLMGFMKGWSASYARLGPHTVIMFLTAERLRAYAGLQAL